MNILWAKSISGNGNDILYDVIKDYKENVIVVGSFDGDEVNLTSNIVLNNTATDKQNSKFMILKLGLDVGVPELQELVVENAKKVFKIITNVVAHEEKDENGNILMVNGGTISGNDVSASANQDKNHHRS